MYAPIARILIRYGAGLLIGLDSASILAGDPDIVSLVAAGLAFATETLYVLAKRRGWAT
jgi:hypothetical protein